MPVWNHLPYGLRGDQIVYIHELNEETEYGLKCNCVCPGCGDPLVARIRGTKREKHFAHHNGSDCGKGYETAIHRMAKEVIEEGVKIKLPPVVSEFGDKGYFVINDVILFQASLSEQGFTIIPDEGKTRIEEDYGTVRPDVVIETSGNPLFIEIFVTHAVDEIKLQQIIELGISCIEIDFSYYKDSILEKEDLRKALEGKDKNVEVKWVFNQRIHKQDKTIRENLENCMILDLVSYTPRKERKISDYGYRHNVINDRIVLNCPKRLDFKPMSYQASIEDCQECDCNRGCLRKIGSKNKDCIICAAGDNEVEIRSSDACSWLIGCAKKCEIPASEDKCKELVDALVEMLGPYASSPDVMRTKQEASRTLIGRMRFKKQEESKRADSQKYRFLYRSIYENLNSLIYWASSTFDIWSSWAFKKAKDVLLSDNEFQFSEEEIKTVFLKKAKEVWEGHLKEAESLYEKDNSFKRSIDHLLEIPFNDGEKVKAWLYRVFSSVKRKNGTIKIRVLGAQKYSEITILPLLENKVLQKYKGNFNN